jgi:hypothetical protein
MQASSLAKTNTIIVVSTILSAMAFQFLWFALAIPAEAALSYQCGLLIADGKVPFIDFFEVASPALMYINAIPAVVCKIIPAVHQIIVFHACLIVLMAASFYLSAAILFRQRIREQSHAPLFIIGFALLNLLAINEAGQRENLFLLFYIPFFLCRWLAWSNQHCEKRLSLIAGISGGIAACLDPLCLLTVVTMELFFLITKLKFAALRSTEMISAVAVIAIFFCHFAFFPAEYANTYFNWALRLVLCDYGMFDERLYWVDKTPDLRKLIYAVVFAIVICLGLRRWCALIAPCIGLSLVGLCLFIIEGRTMTYQTLPMCFAVGLAVFLVLSVVLNGLAKWRTVNLSRLKPVAVAVVCIVGFAGFVAYKLNAARQMKTIDMATIGYFGTTYVTDPSEFATKLMEQTSVNDPVMILNDRVRPAYPLIVQYKRKPSGYLLTGFPIRMSRMLIDSNIGVADKYAGKQFQMYERLLKDIQAKPTMIMLEKDSLGNVLKDQKVLAAIEALYDESSYALFPDTEAEPSFDYYGFRTALVVYKLKGAPATPPAVPAVEPNVPAPAK